MGWYMSTEEAQVPDYHCLCGILFMEINSSLALNDALPCVSGEIRLFIPKILFEHLRQLVCALL